MTTEEFNRKCIEQLEAANFCGRIAVVGAGPSNPAFAPLKDLQEKLCFRCKIVQKSGEYFWDFCERAHDANPAEYYNVIEECYGAPPHWDGRTYTHLAAINFKSYVTLNYDNQLPSAFRMRHPDDCEQLFSIYPCPVGQITAQPADLWHRQRLVAVHGYADPKNPKWPREIILRSGDYNDHYLNHGTSYFLFNWWKNLLATHPCVFIGTSLTEPGLHRVVQALLKDNNGALRERNHIHLRDTVRSATAPYYPPPGKSLDVLDQILFDRVDNRFSGLVSVLSHFSKIPAENPSPGMPAPKPIMPTEKFSF